MISMKNNKIAASWNKIEPDDSADERMLSAILEQNRSVHDMKNKENNRSASKKTWLQWGLAAVCVCLLVFGAVKLLGGRQDPSGIQQWSASMKAKDYFRNNKKAPDESLGEASIVMPPYAAYVLISDQRSLLEAEGILPAMPEHPEQSFMAAYNGDGSLYKLEFWWMRRSEHGLDEYSDLIITAAPRELHEITDTISSYEDINGDFLPEYITATVRDGITIYAAGVEKSEKTLTWQTDQGWYRITGSFNDSFEDMAALLDWFWGHPLSLSRFPASGETIASVSRAEHPDLFNEQLPDFAALGYTAENEQVNMGMLFDRWVPVWFDCVYTRGETRIRWTVSAGADKDAWAACLGRPIDITKEKITNALSQKNSFNVEFLSDSIYDTVYMATLTLKQGTADDAWEIIQTLQ